MTVGVEYNGQTIRLGTSVPVQNTSIHKKKMFSPIASSPLESLTAGVTGVSLAVEYQNCLHGPPSFTAQNQTATATSVSTTIQSIGRVAASAER